MTRNLRSIHYELIGELWMWIQIRFEKGLEPHGTDFQLIKWHNIFTTLISLIKFNFIAKSFGINLLCVHSFCTTGSNHIRSQNWIFYSPDSTNFFLCPFSLWALNVKKRCEFKISSAQLWKLLKFQHCTCHFD